MDQWAQIAVCWITVSGQNVYTTNYLTNDMSSYTAGRKGSLTLNDPVAGGAQAGTCWRSRGARAG
jgi:hypothetical protein